VQTEDFAAHETLFSADYAYFSSFSTSWLAHVEAYARDMIQRYHLSSESMICEVAANDGYLLQHFQKAGIPCYGVEPTASTAAAARARGITILEDFCSTALADKLVQKGWRADLIAANNVLAHVPDINDFVRGFATLLKPAGIATFEFPHLLKMVQHSQFDTVYHEHYSYLSCTAVSTIFNRNRLTLIDVEELPTHGGSLRIYAQRASEGVHPVSSSVTALLEQEREAGINTRTFYQAFQTSAETVKNDLLAFLIDLKRNGKKICGYGAAAKGNTILNFAGIRRDLLPYVVDRSPAKQNKFLPGSHIPVVSEAHLKTDKPDYILILPWNLRTELEQQLRYTREWGAKLVTATPRIRVS